MATTAIWTIKGTAVNLNRVVVYIENPDKTIEKHEMEATIDNLNHVMSYAVDESKTEEKKYVTGINCNAATAINEMRLTKQMNQKEDGILAYHGYQSFRPGEVTPEQAHQIGIELAERMWGDRFEVVVATHLDHEHIHNHFVVNSVSCVDGKKYYCRPWTWKDLRRASDEICKAHGLSVIENPRTHKDSAAAWQEKREGEGSGNMEQIKSDILEAIKRSGSMTDFFREMKNMGYECMTGGKYFRVIPPGKVKAVRVDRRLGEEYTLDAIQNKIKESGKVLPEKPAARQGKKKQQPDLHTYYVRYSILLMGYRKKSAAATSRRKTYINKEDMRRMSTISAEVRFLYGRNRLGRTISDLDDVNTYIKDTDIQLHYLYAAQKKLQNQIRRKEEGEEKEELRARLKETNRNIKEHKNEKYYCCDIKEQTQNRLEVLQNKEEERSI